VIELGIGQPDVTLPVQTDAMQLHLHVVVAVPRAVEQDVGRFVHLEQAPHLEAGVRSQRRNELAR
jgi:hypothetical protein